MNEQQFAMLMDGVNKIIKLLSKMDKTTPPNPPGMPDMAQLMAAFPPLNSPGFAEQLSKIMPDMRPLPPGPPPGMDEHIVKARMDLDEKIARSINGESPK